MFKTKYRDLEVTQTMVIKPPELREAAYKAAQKLRIHPDVKEVYIDNGNRITWHWETGGGHGWAYYSPDNDADFWVVFRRMRSDFHKNWEAIERYLDGLPSNQKFLSSEQGRVYARLEQERAKL